MSSPIFKHAARTSAVLSLFAVVGTALLAATYLATKDVIAATEQKAKLALIGQILPPSLYNNDIIKDASTLPPSPLLGTSDPTVAYRAYEDGKPSAVVMEAIAPDGYAGKIKLIVAVKADGAVSGVRVISHNETPGLGDYIEIGKSKWINVFAGKSLKTYTDRDWKVKKDGGKFEHMAGATITPRAVVKAVHKALQYFAAHRDEIFSAPATSQEEAKK
jgi:electron transport complex protein RnfG